MIEDKIQKAIKPILSIYSKIELELIEKIAKHFNLNEEFINSDYWYFEKLKELGGLNNETLKLLEEYTGKTRQELLKAMKDIGISSIPVDQLNIATQKNALLNPETIINSTNIQNIIQYSYDEIEKSFLNLNKTIQEQVRQTYTDIITETYIKTNAGVCSYQEAILNSLDKLGDKGISILTYQNKNGLIKNYDVVGTVRRDLLVATRGLAGKVNEEVIKESGNHVVRVTNHFGARTGDGGEDYTNHAWWQELQFFCWNYDGKATEEEKKLPDFMKHCNYGDVRGIVGINCKHLFTVWYGSTKKEDLEFTYDENKEQYEKTQQQRYLENGVRKWKRKQVIANKVEDEEGYKKSSIKAKEWQDRLNKFTKENDLKEDYTRQHVKGYKPVSTEEKQYIDITEEIIKKDKQNFKLIEQQYYIDENGNQYNVDGKYILLEPTEREKEVANMLGELYGGNIKIIPRINEPKGIKTPDYIVKNKRYDLKQIKGNGKYVIQGNLKGKQKQADNFIIDITKSEINIEEAIKQIENIYSSKHFLWLDRIVLLKGKELLKIYKRK
uniref:Minor capsid protein n=2 Tax=unclassified Caudoviricetes TaxID=2788787 RepID=A0A8S5QH67_9CAUD|nr:MAG TPA: minor capsid protein [Siphoviridae sp. ctMkg9]DAE17884.1 MAG TPA: minor capsid protein [Siphoviridae sp. ctRBF36]